MENITTPSTPYAHETAQIILDAEAFLCNADKPFKLTSGMYSPFYINCRQLISSAQGRLSIAKLTANMVRDSIGLANIDVIAGGVTAGVPFATSLADTLELPLVYIRPEPKAHGTGGQIEGGDVEGKRVLLVEDLITNATSTGKFVKAIREAGGVVEHQTVVLSRATEKAHGVLSELGLSLHALCAFDDILGFVKAGGKLTGEQIAAIEGFIADPAGWSKPFEEKFAVAN